MSGFSLITGGSRPGDVWCAGLVYSIHRIDAIPQFIKEMDAKLKPSRFSFGEQFKA